MNNPYLPDPLRASIFQFRDDGIWLHGHQQIRDLLDCEFTHHSSRLGDGEDLVKFGGVEMSQWDRRFDPRYTQMTWRGDEWRRRGELEGGRKDFAKGP